jgi:protein-S-isoprenylcysteine O-methyltransferase Ste14
MVASAGMFRRLGTGVRPFTPATVLVARGPFRVSRNPMYLGMVLMLVGLGMALGTTVPLLVPPLFAVVIDRRFICREEEFLADRFGAPYREFCRRVRRWL